MNLSVIIPHYNSASSLTKLIMSVKEECPSAQIIVVDDNSTKDINLYKEVCDRFANEVEFYINDSGIKGAGAARNIGLKAAKGDWLLFADADDYFVPGWFEAVKKYENDEYDIVYFSPECINITTGEPGKRANAYKRYVREYVEKIRFNDAERYLRYFFIVPWSKLVRASLVKEKNITFDEVMYSNDVMFSIKSGTYAKKVCGDSHSIYCVTEQGESLTTNTSEEAWGARQEVYSRRNLFLRQNLNKEDYKFNKLRMGAFGRLVVAVQRRCGFKNFIKYCNMYRVNKVPVFYSFLYTVRCHVAVRLKGQKWGEQ